MGQRTIIVRTIYIVLFLSGFCSADLQAQDWGDAGPGGWITIPPADYQAANSVVVFDRARVQVEIFEGWGVYPRLTTRRHIRFKALTRAGVDEIGNYQLAFHEKTEFTKFEAQTLCPDGSIIPVKKEDIHLKRDGDWQIRSLAFSSLDSGCIVEIRYEFSEDYFLTYFPWTFSSNLYTLESQFTLELGCDCQYIYQATNFPAGRSIPITSRAEGTSTSKQYPSYSWRLTNLPPIKNEPYMTCVDDHEVKIQVRLSGIGQPWKELTWEQMGKIYDESIENYVTLPRGFRETIAKITKGCETKYDKSKAIYDYIVKEFETRQDSYRRILHHKNLNGLWEKRYGTALEKNLLLVEMLRKAHIECWPVLICTRDHARFDPTWKEFEQFSHILVFAEVEQGGIYLDASSKYCVYGTLPPVCRVDAGLLIDGLNSELLRVVTNDPTSYRFDQTTIRLNSEGNAACSTSCMILGYLAADYGERFQRTAPDKFIAEVALPGLPKMAETPVSSCALDSLGRFNIQAQYSIPGYAQVVGSALVASAPDFMFGENVFKSEYRFTAVDFNYAFTYHSVVTLIAEDSTSVVEPPKDVSFNIDGITYIRESTKIGNSARVESVLKITRPVYGINEYPLVREMFRRVAETAAEPLTWQTTGS
jgi:hypothetical protein